LWIMFSLFVVATFIDFEHFIIPDAITWGGAAAGLVCSVLVPQLHETDSRLQAALQAIIGGALGYFLLWGVGEAGKLAFGRRRVVLEKPENFTWTREGDDADLAMGESKDRWSEIFSRPSDRLLMTCPQLTVGGENFPE